MSPSAKLTTMNLALRQPLTREQFFTWVQAQEHRYEFDGVQPVAMTGGTIRHNLIMLSTHRALERRLASGSCRPLGPDAGVATVGDIVRYPDAVVTCSTLNQSDHLVPRPVVMVEVVSPSSMRLDRVVKLREYQAVASVRTYVIVESEALAITVLSRDHEDAAFTAAGLTEADVLEISAIGISVPVLELYAGVEFDGITS